MASPLLVFDLDGTLVDSAPDLLATLNAVLPRHGFAASHDPGLRDGIGHGARHLIEYALRLQEAPVDEATLASIHHDFLAYYEDHIADRTRPYPGLVECLDRFAAEGWRFAVCTNKTERLSKELLSRLGLDGRFAAICGGDTFAARKPDAGHLVGTIAAAGGEPDLAIMVGDSATDRDAALNAGVAFAGVTFGYTPVPMAQMRPDLSIENFDAFTPDSARSLLASYADAPASAAARS